MVGSCDGSVHRNAESNFYAASALKSGEGSDSFRSISVSKRRDALVEPVVSGG